MARKKQEPKTVADKIEQVCKDAFLEKDKPSRQYIKKAMAEKYDYTNEALIKKTLGLMVKSGKLIQEGQTFYAKGFKPEPEPEEWKPLPPDDKHYPTQDNSENFPNHPHYEDMIKNSDERSFYKFLFNMYQLEVLYRATGDEERAEAFNTAWSNMLDCSDHNYEEKDKYGNYIGIGHEDMGSNMEANDVKCLRDIHGVGASTVKLIEEWIETGKLKRLEDLKKKCSASDLKQFEFEAKKDFMPDFLEALGKLAKFYEDDDDFRATAFRRAIIALEGQIITAVEDIKLFNLIELKGVGKSTLVMLEEFITSGKIEKLEEQRRRDAMVDHMPGFYKMLETAGYNPMDMYGLTLPSYHSRHVHVFDVKDLDKVKDKVKPEILEMFEEYIETKKVKKLAKTFCEAFIKNHEPLRYYFMKKPIHLSFDKDDPEWNYSGKAQKLDIVISCGFKESVLQLHDFEDILEGGEYDIDQLRNKVQEIQERLDNGDSTTLYYFEGSFTINGVPGQHPFKFGRWIDESDTKLESLGWTPPGLETYLDNKLMGGRNMWDQYVDSDSDGDAPKTNPDQVEWFATLTEEQAGYIQDWWDSEGERKHAVEGGVFGSRGIPFTFEHEGDTYKVDGDAEDHEWEGRVGGVSFEGTIYKNGVEHGTFSMRYEVDTFEMEGDHQTCCIGEDEEDDEDLAEACREAFMEAYVFPDNMAYRE